MKQDKLKLLTAKELAKMFSTSVRSIWRYRAAGMLPKELTLGSSIRWRHSDIESWLGMGCPDVKTFEAMK